MPRYANMLVKGMKERGHDVALWQPDPLFYKMPLPGSFKKWLAYIDQYIVFPMRVRNRLRKEPADAVFVFTDHALGPYVPLVKKRSHVIHCHDFLAQRSARGQFVENPTGFTGRLYQKYIHRGYSKGKNFISISNKTKQDLHEFLKTLPELSEVVYNGLNQDFKKTKVEEARTALSKHVNIDLSAGYVLHVGGNLWYKNRQGVIEIFNAFQNKTDSPVQLLMIGSAPSPELTAYVAQLSSKEKIHFLSAIDDNWLKTAYAGASVFLFPSIAEGFGWPIAEAMASGCQVITTNEAPMTEVAGNAASLIEKRPSVKVSVNQWAIESAEVLENVLLRSVKEQDEAKENGLINIKRFDAGATLDKIEAIYLRIHAKTKK